MPGSSTFRTVLGTKTGEHGSGPIPLGPRYYFGQLTDPLEELVPRPTGSGAGAEPFAGTPQPAPPIPLPASIPGPGPGPDSIVTVRQPRNAQEPSTAQVTRPRPATAPDGTVAGSTPPCQGTPLPHQVEVQSTVAPAATA